MSSSSKKSLVVGLVTFVAVIAISFVFFRLSVRPNPALSVKLGKSPYFADSVTVPPGTALFFTWGVTPSPRAKAIARGETKTPRDRYGDTYAQARALMTQLTEDLREAGLSLRDVIAVRANLVAEPTLDMDGWNKAFGEFFGNVTNPHKPARTTIGISRLFHPDYLAEVEFVAAIPPGRGPFEKGSRFERLYDRLNRITTNDNVRSYGRPTWALSTGKAIAGGSSLYFQSAIAPDPMMPNMAAMPVKMRMFKGDTFTQSQVLFKKHVAALTEAGLKPEDSFFSRNILFPDKTSGKMDFSGFNKAYSEVYNNPENPNRLARTVMSAPGFAQQGQQLTIETYAVYPGTTADNVKRFTAEDGKKSALKAFRKDEKANTSSGVATSPEAKLTFISGLISDERGDLKKESADVMTMAKEKLEAVGATFDNVVQLRAYIVNGADGAGGVTIFEAAYNEAFKGAHKPAVTFLPVKALAKDAKVEVEILAATLP